MSETETKPKVERKVQTDKDSHETVYKGTKRPWRERLKGILRPVFNSDRVRNAGLAGLVCVVGIILFLTLKGGKNNDRS